MRFFFTIVIILASFNSTVSAQIGSCKEQFSLEDNSFVGSFWEPKGTISYTEKDGVGKYGFIISIFTDDTYLDCNIGHKVSIEYTDDTKELYEIVNNPKSYETKVVAHKIVSIYQRMLLIYPNFENLSNKCIKRIVIQRANGKVWAIDTKPKRAKKLMTEIPKAMKEAYESYLSKVSNDNYFKE